MTTNPNLLFNPFDWYWLANDGRIYCSARNKLVYPYDSSYLAFVAKNGGTTPWPTDTKGNQTTDAMQAVVAPFGIILSFS